MATSAGVAAPVSSPPAQRQSPDKNDEHVTFTSCRLHGLTKTRPRKGWSGDNLLKNNCVRAIKESLFQSSVGPYSLYNDGHPGKS